ncbi:MAG: arylsulfatase [Planctomycetaceae bacterium]|nr:arylsulfatase [Planctomycetaceae bacterium]
MSRITLLLLFAALFASFADDSDAAHRPNIIVIMADDMGFSDIGCYGGEIQTPVLDGLAANGVRFSQFYNTGRCCPTRAALLSGLYSHQAGVGHMMNPRQGELARGYAGDLNRNCVTMAEQLKPAGYRTYGVGKWHVAVDIKPEGPKHNWPLQRGFDRFYGTITGAGSFFDPGTLTRGNEAISPFSDPEYKPDQYYYTDAISDHAVRFISDHHQQDGDKPFFMYLMYTCAHWPMHALEKDIAKYKGKYDAGYKAARDARVAKLKKLGFLSDDWDVTPQVGSWDNVEHKEWEARCMEVYAAMIDNMDQGIGRVMESLKATGQYDNTLVMYFQDNGGCAEGVGRRENMQRPDKPTLKPIAVDALRQDVIPRQNRAGIPTLKGPNIMPGPEDTYIAYGQSWANVSNTPFREYKHWVHEGGIATPLIAHWPAGISKAQHGKLESQPAHLIDIMATCVDLGKATHPKTLNEHDIHPLEGVSLAPAFNGKSLNRKNPIFFEHEGNRAVRDGKWKLVAKGARGKWELYDMESDRTEMHDLSEKEPERLKTMIGQWEAWAKRAFVLPWPWDQKAKYSKKKSFKLQQGAELAGNRMPNTGRKAVSIEAQITKPGQGVIVAQGGVTHGFAVLVDRKGQINVALRHGGKLNTYPVTAAPTSAYSISVNFGQSKDLVVAIDGKQVLKTETLGTMRQTPLDSFTVGFDSNDPVGKYERTFKFSGEIKQLNLKLK